VRNRELLLASLEVAVPLWAQQLSKIPLRQLLAEGPALARIIAESGDVLQFKGGRQGATAEAFNGLARALAILSFLPHGVKFCGVTMKNVHPDDEDRR
jgi:hypothetical protein